MEIKKVIKNGQTYTLPSGGGGSANIIRLTQAEYDALVETQTIDENAIYVIEDAESNYYNKEEVDTLIENATPANYKTISGYAENAISSISTGNSTNYGTLYYKKSTGTSNTTLVSFPKLKINGTNNNILGNTNLIDLDTYTDGKVATKQDTLVSGTNIKTINNQSILGNGNITIEGGGGGNVNFVNLTQAEYDALTEKDPNVIYNITDATDIDVYTKEETNHLLDGKQPVGNYALKSEIPTDFYTKAETDTLIDGKQDTLVSGTNIKTINGKTLLGEGNIVIQGGEGGGDNIKAGDGIYISEDEEGVKVISTLPIETSANTYVAWCDEFENWTVDYFDDGEVPTYKYRGKNVVKAIFGEGINKLGGQLFGGYNTTLKEVVVKGTISIWNYETINGLKVYAFACCSALRSVTFFNSQTIGIDIFGANTTSYEGNQTNYVNVTFYLPYQGRLSIGGIAKASRQLYLKDLNLNDINRYSNTIGKGIVYNSVGGYATSVIGSSKDITVVNKFTNNITSIGEYAFNGCYNLTSATISNSVTSIGEYAFNGCYNLTSVTIPDSVTSIGIYAFSSCSGLTSVTIPNSVTSIGSGTFYYCSGLVSVTIPNSVTSIGSYAFYALPTTGTLYCDEDWFNNLSDTNKTNLGNVANWERKPIPKPIEERVDDIEAEIGNINSLLENIIGG